MTTHITKTWFDGKNIVTQEIPVEEVYKREWVGLTDEDYVDMGISLSLIEWQYKSIEAKLKEKNTCQK